MTDERAWKNNSNNSGACGKQQLVLKPQRKITTLGMTNDPSLGIA